MRMWLFGVTQILNLFLALLLNAFSSENMNQGQQQQQQQQYADGVHDDDDDDEKARSSSDSQLSAAYERVGRWVKFVAARVGELKRRRTPPATDSDVDDAVDGALETAAASDVHIIAAAARPDTVCRRTSTQPALLVDSCTDGQVHLFDVTSYVLCMLGDALEINTRCSCRICCQKNRMLLPV